MSKMHFTLSFSPTSLSLSILYSCSPNSFSPTPPLTRKEDIASQIPEGKTMRDIDMRVYTRANTHTHAHTGAVSLEGIDPDSRVDASPSLLNTFNKRKSSLD